jgi:hypothetical protein
MTSRKGRQEKDAKTGKKRSKSRHKKNAHRQTYKVQVVCVKRTYFTLFPLVKITVSPVFQKQFSLILPSPDITPLPHIMLIEHKEAARPD